MDERVGTAGGRGDRPPGFVQADDGTAAADKATRQPPGEEVARAGDHRGGRTADRGAAGPLGRPRQAIQSGRHRRPGRRRGVIGSEKPSRSAPIIRARRSRAASAVAGRPSAVERSSGLDCDVAQGRGRRRASRRRARRPGRWGRLGTAARSPGRRPACGGRRRRPARRSGAARCRSAPGRRRAPRSSGIRSVVVVPMSIRIAGSSGTSRAASVASASQLAAAASSGRSPRSRPRE